MHRRALWDPMRSGRMAAHAHHRLDLEWPPGTACCSPLSRRLRLPERALPTHGVAQSGAGSAGDGLSAVALAPDGCTLATGDYRGCVKLFAIAGGDEDKAVSLGERHCWNPKQSLPGTPVSAISSIVFEVESRRAEDKEGLEGGLGFSSTKSRFGTASSTTWGEGGEGGEADGPAVEQEKPRLLCATRNGLVLILHGHDGSFSHLLGRAPRAPTPPSACGAEPLAAEDVGAAEEDAPREESESESDDGDEDSDDELDVTIGVDVTNIQL